MSDALTVGKRILSRMVRSDDRQAQAFVWLVARGSPESGPPLDENGIAIFDQRAEALGKAVLTLYGSNFPQTNDEKPMEVAA